MAQEQKPADADQAKKPGKAWLPWVLFGAFIVGSIVFMLVIDFIYAPELNDSATLPEAVGK